MHDLDAVAKDTGLGKARTTVRHTRGGGATKGRHLLRGRSSHTTIALLWSPPTAGVLSHYQGAIKWPHMGTK